MIISLQIWRCPNIPSLFLSNLNINSTCVGLGEGGWKFLSTIRHCDFYYAWGQAVSQAYPGTLSHYRSRCLGLPTQRQVLFILICILLFLLKLEEPGACSLSTTDLLDI